MKELHGHWSYLFEIWMNPKTYKKLITMLAYKQSMQKQTEIIEYVIIIFFYYLNLKWSVS